MIAIVHLQVLLVFWHLLSLSLCILCINLKIKRMYFPRSDTSFTLCLIYWIIYLSSFFICWGYSDGVVVMTLHCKPLSCESDSHSYLSLWVVYLRSHPSAICHRCDLSTKGKQTTHSSFIEIMSIKQPQFLGIYNFHVWRNLWKLEICSCKEGKILLAQ